MIEEDDHPAAGRQSPLGSLALWMHRRFTPSRRLDLFKAPDLPPGDGPIVWFRLGRGLDELAPLQITGLLRRSRPDVRVIMSMAEGGKDGEPADDTTGARPHVVPDPVGDKAARALLDAIRPAMLILVGPDLPAAMIAATHERHIPIMMVEARLTSLPQAFWPMRHALGRGLLARIDRIMVPDAGSRAEAVRQGAVSDRLETIGTITETLAPLHCFEGERDALAKLIRNRQVWFAACVTAPEEAIVLNAHRMALRHSHRLLLILQPSDPSRITELARALREAGWVVAVRADNEDPDEEVQILIVDDPAELGLWYRIASVSFIGGTIVPDGTPPRHPFEAAALGSAILHGRETAPYGTAFEQLNGGNAARIAGDEGELIAGLTDLLSPEQAANLATAAWQICTGGAAVAERVARRILARLPAPDVPRLAAPGPGK
ncbi:3-deoxy-D-manno-octulosonic acid transferase [Paracoccus pacificus]|uniref:3-deoxy-D-manno-octulosonic acid transferase n=1 Tax=Paracoccus pacificus TaxID=1463598 RepID=A0ABW4R200_9RHOB